jgi:hypothetical protein
MLFLLRIADIDQYKGNVGFGSWLCKNGSTESMMPSDLGDLAEYSHFAEFLRLSVLESLLIENSAVLGCAVTADGRRTVAAMPSSPPGAAGCP